MNRLYFGDNLKWLSDRKEFPDASVDLVYLDPPFNSNADYNVLFREPSGQVSQAQFHAGGDPTQNWLILRNENTTIGLFQGMFERNTLTFNPRWTGQAETLKEFDDVRKIQRSLKANGLALTSEADESTTGPASLSLIDPDGNPILVDQHVDCPQN
jgi:DNA modification methylase